MKRLAIYLVLSLAVTGCRTHPLVLAGLTPARRDDVYDCAHQRVTDSGYVAGIDSKQAGLLTARRQTFVRDMGKLGGKAQYDELTVSVTEADSAMRKVEVTAGRATEVHMNSKVSRTERGPGDKVQAEAQALLNACTQAVVGDSSWEQPAFNIQREPSALAYLTAGALARARAQAVR
jgi:hypothetical protein